MTHTCALCENEVQNGQFIPGGIMEFECKTCGWYQITTQAESEIRANTKWKRQISAYTRHRTVMKLPPVTLFSEAPTIDVFNPFIRITLEEAFSWFPKNVIDRLHISLINLAAMSTYPGENISIKPSDYPLFCVDNLNNSNQAQSYMVQQLIDQGLISGNGNLAAELYLTAAGWEKVSSLQAVNTDSKQAFIAMWFDQCMDESAELGLKRAVVDAGYKPIKINELEHNGHIDDEIIAQIRQSKFVVCDFTGQRAGVYFEAGFALGLGLPVIWTCHEEYIGKLHFDTRQYNHIVWKSAEDLYRQLYNRIRATIL